jgi:CheY-like chemotaxis protein
VRLEVVDTGIGIPRGARDSIFEPFVQDAGARRFGGTGLGLSISRHLVQLMESELRCESEPGRGSRFWFDLRLARGSQAIQRSEPEPEAAPRQGAVLAVEDNALLGGLLKSMLTSLGLRAEIVTTGSAALAALARETYDVVLMDWELPEMSGPDAARAMRRTLGGQRLPIICMSGHTIREHDAAWLAADMDGLLPKPFRLNDLRKALARWLPALNTGTQAP